MYMCKTGSKFFTPLKSGILASLFAVLIKLIAKYFEVLRTCSGSVAMATIYIVMFDTVV